MTSISRLTHAGLTIACLVGVAGCLGSGESRRAAAGGDCLPPADESRPASEAPAMVALVGGRRLLRISLPDGAVEAERRVGSRSPGPPVDDRDEFRLEASSGPSLVSTPDGRTVAALLREPAPGPDRVAVIDARTLRVRCSNPLVKGVRHTSLLLGRSGRFYAIGNRSAGVPGRWDAVLTIGDLRTGGLSSSPTLRRAAARGEPDRGAKDWYVYRAALSPDERRLILSYHGSDTTGGDWFRISRRLDFRAGEAGDRRCRRRLDGRCPPGGWPDIGWLHGGVAPVGAGFVGTTGSSMVLKLDRQGRETARLRVRGGENHVMDFALDARRRLAYLSLCAQRPTLHRLDLARGGQKILHSGGFCGRPLAVHRGRFLLVDATPVSRRGYPRTVEPELRLFDLRHSGAGRPVARSSGALDAVVVGTSGR